MPKEIQLLEMRRAKGNFSISPEASGRKKESLKKRVLC